MAKSMADNVEYSSWPTGDSEMARRIRAHDGNTLSLGPIEGWPRSLKAAIELMLASREPVYIAWGPNLFSFYNDAYIPILGTKHPAALGCPYSEVFAEIWAEYRPLTEQTMPGMLSFSSISRFRSQDVPACR